MLVGVGSRDEPPELAGASHFLEHVLFKDTVNHNGLELAIALDRIGGDANAYTGRESTVFHARVPARHATEALQLLLEVVCQPTIRYDDVEVERDVILEELAAGQDLPEDRAHELAMEQMFGSHSLGRETIGSRESVARLDARALRDFHRTWYRPEAMVVSACGGVDHDDLAAVLDETPWTERGGIRPRRSSPDRYGSGEVALTRAGEQCHLVMARPSLPSTHPDRFALAVALQVLGGGLSSRLFQLVREERGLAYNVYASQNGFTDSGVAVVAAATSPIRLRELRECIDAEVERFLEHGIGDQELETAVNFLSGWLEMATDDPMGAASWMGSSYYERGEVPDLEEDLASLAEVTAGKAVAVARSVLAAQPAVAVVGPDGGAD